MWCIKFSSLNSLRIWGPPKIPSYILASLSFSNCLRKYMKHCPCLSKASVNFFSRPSFICNGGRRIFDRSINGSRTLWLPRFSAFLFSHCVSLQSLLSHKHKKHENSVNPARDVEIGLSSTRSPDRTFSLPADEITFFLLTFKKLHDVFKGSRLKG